MTLETVQAIAPSPIASPTPWVGGQLPSPWSAPSGSQVPTATPNSFAQSLEQARSAASSSSSMAIGSVNQAGIRPVNQTPQDNSVSKKIGFSAIETMGTRLSEADAKIGRSVESLTNIDMTAPNIHAEFLSVSLMSAKASISTTLAMKFSSKINESINTLLKTS